MPRKPTDPTSRAASLLGKRRWTETGDDPAAIGALGGIAARKKSGRKLAPDRCPCGSMTKDRAAKRNHRCE